MAMRRTSGLWLLSGTLALLALGACGDHHPPVTNCGSGMVYAELKGKSIPLASCAGLVGDGGPTVRLNSGDAVTVGRPNSVGTRPFALFSENDGVVAVEGHVLRAQAPGKTTVDATGLTCIEQVPTCSILTIVVN